MVHIRNERHNKKWLPENQLIPSFNLLYDHLLLFSAKGLIPLLIRPFCSFHPIFHVQHLFQLFPKGFILSSPFFFLVSDSGLFFFPAGNVDLLHTMLLLQDALGCVVQIDFLLMGSPELFPASLPMNSVHLVNDSQKNSDPFSCTGRTPLCKSLAECSDP